MSQPGTYSLTLEGRLPKRTASILVLEVAVLPAVFRPASKITVKQLRNSMPLWDSEPLMPLTVQPASRAIKLTHVSATLDGVQLAPGGGLHFEAEAPDGVLRLTPKLTGNFPVGNFSGTVLVRATQLAEPLAIPFEVQSRRSTWLILLVLAVGIAVGHLVRKLLQRTIERTDAQQQAGQLLTQINRRSSYAADQLLINSLRAIENELITKVHESPAIELAKAIDSASISFNETQKEFDGRLQNVKAKADGTHVLLDPQWQLPEPLANTVEAGRLKLPLVDRLLLAGNAYGADSELKLLLRQLCEKLNTQLPAWKLSRESLLQNIGSVIPPAQQDAWNAFVKELLPKLQTISIDSVSMSEDKLMAAFNATHDVEINLAAQATNVISALTILSNKIERDLTILPGIVQPALLPKLHPHVLALGKQFKASLGDTNAPEPDVPSFIQAWKRILGDQLPPTASPDGEQAIQELLAKADFLAATDRIRELYAREVGVRNVRPKVANQPSAPSLLFASEYAQAREPDTGTNTAPDLTTLTGLSQWTKALTSFRNRTRFIQALLIAGVLVWTGYILFAEEFIGSPKQLLTVFPWGFFSDLTVDRLQAVSPSAKQLA
ncbi:hypothetical protein [Hymenobacter perfusus]|uniref:Uncharacterized protein n=1 Tax=Hymenobacter perfusus TaxID=1236770 RepID=A0A428JXI6_9BACT|nr:hypothetical protein [Hymenobacter perfusus]RSK38919.1 hypothetical protein EI293_20580 [Hymenobacter perfusus]